PFFLIAHQLARSTNKDADGYSSIYHKWISYGTIVYALLALLMIAKVIGLYFSDLVSAIVVVLIGLGTNFYYYAVHEHGLSHIPGLFVLGLFLYYTIKWHQNPSFKSFIILLIALSLATIIRPTNILFGLFFILLVFQKDKGFKSVFLSLKSYGNKWLILVPAGLFFPILQIALWKYNSGNYIQYSYGDEGFFFGHPHLLYGLFSARNGLFLYSLPFLLSIYALFIRKSDIPTLPIVIVLIVFYYVIYSWWCWWYGGSYGSRAAIESYILLAMLLAVTIDYIIKNVYPFLSIIFFIGAMQITFEMTTYFTTLKLSNLVHYDAMTWEAYKYLWSEENIGMDYFQLWEHPDYKGSHDNGEEYVNFQELNPKIKYSEGVLQKFQNVPSDSVYVKFIFWGEESFYGDPVVYLEIVCEETNYFQKLAIKPEFKSMEWNSGIQPILFEKEWLNEKIHFRLIFEGKRRIFYKPIEVFTNKPSEPTL
ncbi:MAG: hypothetical protein KDK36_16385, partial [Leptospiraceae bacterium]|nr:hypothetical protein [Leptospiraceae bacterium]